MTTSYGVVGTDGVVPVYSPDSRWCWWSISEIYTGGQGHERYVPKVNDYIKDPDTNADFVVISIDPTTLIATFVPIQSPVNNYIIDQPDVLFGVGPGTTSDTYRAYLDTSVTPHVLSVDTRLKVAGTMSSYCKIFKGTDLGQTAQVISAVYDNSNNFVTNNIPLQLAALDSLTNFSIKIVSSCYSTVNMLDGELVTVVIYSEDGHVVSKRQLIVENTGFIRPLDAGENYIIAISLETPFLSPTIDSVVTLPINVPVDSLNIRGVVQYSNGSTQSYPVDGSKFNLLGIDQYVASIVGYEMDLTLRYTLSTNESTYSATYNNRYITAPYKIVTVNPNNAYSVKLFGYPEWQGQISGYRIRWFLLNLDRNISLDVTDYVTFATQTGVFNPLGFGILQNKVVNINLQDVSNGFLPYIHTQVYSVTLNGPPSSNLTPWTVQSVFNASHTTYGQGLYAARAINNVRHLRIDCGIHDIHSWLIQVYNNTYPLIDPYEQAVLILPDVFEITYKTTKIQYPISEWNSILDLGVEVIYGENVYIKFSNNGSSSEINLSVAGLCINHTF